MINRPTGIFESEIKDSFLSNRFANREEMNSVRAMVLHGLYLGLYAIFKYLHIPFFNIPRALILKLFSKHIETNAISDGVTIWFPWNTRIGKYTTLNQGVIVDGFGGVEIGNGVRIAAYTCINTADHRFDDIDLPIKDQGYVVAGVRIEDNVWIGSGVKICKGVTIGSGSVVGAGSVVTKDIPPFSIAAGVPCKVIKSRISSDN